MKFGTNLIQTNHEIESIRYIHISYHVDSNLVQTSNLNQSPQIIHKFVPIFNKLIRDH